jgi:hypothetical protein
MQIIDAQNVLASPQRDLRLSRLSAVAVLGSRSSERRTSSYPWRIRGGRSSRASLLRGVRHVQAAAPARRDAVVAHRLTPAGVRQVVISACDSTREETRSRSVARARPLRATRRPGASVTESRGESTPRCRGISGHYGREWSRDYGGFYRARRGRLRLQPRSCLRITAPVSTQPTAFGRGSVFVSVVVVVMLVSLSFRSACHFGLEFTDAQSCRSDRVVGFPSSPHGRVGAKGASDCTSHQGRL